MAAREKSPRRRRVRVTGLGCGALVLILMITAAAVNTGTNLLYLMLAGLLAFWTFSIIAGSLNLRGLDVVRHLPSEIHARRAARIEYEIRNEKRRIAAFGITLRDSLAQPGRPPLSAHYLSIPARGKSRKPAELRAGRRGPLRLSRVTLHGSFPFGFLEFIRTFPLEDELLVYPELIPVEPLVSARAVELGAHDSRRRGPGSNLHAIRDYVAGDPSRAIHWKLSAKGAGIKIRETEREESRRVRIVLDYPLGRAPGGAEMERFEQAVSAAASLADLFLDRGIETALWSPAGAIPPGSGPRQWRQIMTALALVDPAAFQDGGPPRPPGGEFMDIVVSHETLDPICSAAASTKSENEVSSP